MAAALGSSVVGSIRIAGSAYSYPISSRGLVNAAGRIRTCDPRIKSPLLCQLSYGGRRPSSRTVADFGAPPDVYESRTPDQWRKWRRLVKTIAAPAPSTASTTSWSRIDPPGWMIAVTPASSASCGPSANGKNASEASDRALAAAIWAFSMREADRVDAAHLAGADADVAPSRARTIAFERTCLQTFQANSSSPHSASVGTSLGDDLHLGALLEVVVAVLDEHAADDLAQGRVDACPGCGARGRRGSACSAWSRAPRGRPRRSRARTGTSMNWPTSASASARSTRRFRQITPPKADIGSHANARW